VDLAAKWAPLIRLGAPEKRFFTGFYPSFIAKRDKSVYKTQQIRQNRGFAVGWIIPYS
jgi:hypothetical protein